MKRALNISLTICSLCIYGCVESNQDLHLFIKSITGPDGQSLDTTALALAVHPDGGLTFIAELEPYTFEIVANTSWIITYPLWCEGFTVQNDLEITSISNGDTLSGNALIRIMSKRDGLIPAGPLATDRDPNRSVTKDGQNIENQLILRYGKKGKCVVPLHVYMPLGMVFIAGARTNGELFSVAHFDDWNTAVYQGFARNEPVLVPEHFYLSKFTITQKQWETIMGDNPSDFQYSDYEDPDNRPINRISWHEIVGGNVIRQEDAYLSKINSLSSPYKQEDKEYRLPTVIEWEYAARGGIYRRSVTEGGTDCIYAGFNPGINAVITDYAWSVYNSFVAPREVGMKLGNELGLYDMTGNIWEWTFTPFGSFRIIKGGCWYDDGYDCRVSFWDDGIPTGAFSNVGFRIAF